MTARLLAISCVAFPLSVWAQVTTRPPLRWETCSFISAGGELAHLKLGHNQPETIREEMLAPDTVSLIVQSCRLSAKDLTTVRVVQNVKQERVEIYQLGKSGQAFEILSEQLRNYVRARTEGHTRAFLLAALTNQSAPAAIADPDLRVVAAARKLPPAWLQKTGSGTFTNKAGETASRTTTTTFVAGRAVTRTTIHIPKQDEVCRWVSFALVDGEVAWKYIVRFQANGTIDEIRDSKCDATEFDPGLQKTIREVDNEVEAELRRTGIWQQFGAVHEFWRLKRDQLKARGISWHSPAELNPDTNYD